MTALARAGDVRARLVDPSDRALDLDLLRAWPSFAQAAARAYAADRGPDTLVPAVLTASAIALSRISIPDLGASSQPGQPTNTVGTLPTEAEAGRSASTSIAQSVHSAFRAAQRSLPGPAAAWLDHTERVILAAGGQPDDPLDTALGHWSLALARIDTAHPVVMIGVAATQRRLAAAARNTLEEAVVDGTLDRATVEPLHRAVSHAHIAWAWYQTSLSKHFDPRQPLPVDAGSQLRIVQQAALAIRVALGNDQARSTRLGILTAHDLGAASLAARIVNDPLVDAATLEARIESMATGPLRPSPRTHEPRAVLPAPPSPSITAPPPARVDKAPAVDPTVLRELTPPLERDYSIRRDLGVATQTRLDLGQIAPADTQAAEAAIADGKQAVAELVTYGGRVIRAALARVRHQHTYAHRRDVTQQAWLLATQAATTFDPDKGRWTSYLKQYLDATLRPTAARMDTSGTVLPHINVRVADPDRAAALAKLYGDRLRPLVAGDFGQFSEREPAQQPTEQQALNRLDNRHLERLTDRIVRALDALPPLRRDAVTATYLTPEPLRDVAERHQVSTQTVRREARRGLNELATGLGEPDRPATLDQRLHRRTHLEQRCPSMGPNPVPGIAR